MWVNHEIYWVNNRNNRAETLDVSFRIIGKVPEVWHPETGKTEPVSYTIENGKTKVTLNLSPADAIFVVFRENATNNSLSLRTPIENILSKLTSEWDLSFQPNRGAPDKIKIQELKSWTTNNDAGIKYFSGTATYSKTVGAQKQWFTQGQQLILELGEVKNLAEVIVNGRSLGVLWKKPFRIDITNALKPGFNNLEVKVTNLWVNRLIGDQQPGETNKLTYTTQAFYSSNSTLLPSGLMGPVQIIQLRE